VNAQLSEPEARELSRETIFAGLATRLLGHELYVHDEIDSTNDEAHRLAEAGAVHGTVVLADAQTKGRGRRGRVWTTPKGTALAMSIVLRPELPPQRAPELAFAAALAVCETARALGAKSAQVKWPNDIQCEGRKLSGLLAELRTKGSGLSHVVLGIGVNVNVTVEELPAELHQTATSLAIEAGHLIWRAHACATLINSLERWIDLHAREGFSPLRARWKELAATMGKRVRVEGDRPISGIAEDMDFDGALLIRSDDGQVRRVIAGDVEHLR
jgi:BirA family biotin operon repressor/biotin-[acetyl-CoA-carboxylase] ligase